MEDRILAYADHLTLRPGESTPVRVSAPGPGTYEVTFLRVRSADATSDGPGYKVQEIACAATGSYPARRQPIPRGSSGVISDGAPFALDSFSLRAIIWPTWTDKGSDQCILGNWNAATGEGHALYLDDQGRVAARIGNQEAMVIDQPLLPRRWYVVAASHDGATGVTRLGIKILKPVPGERELASMERKGSSSPGAGAMRIAAWSDSVQPAAHFNGKISEPAIWSRVHDLEALLSLSTERPLPGNDLVARWDLAQGIGTIEINDISGAARHGRLLQLPTRAVTSWNWDGSENDWRRRPEQYGAVHFHDDDLNDCGWESDFSLRIPEDLKSGIYCLRFRQGQTEVYRPVFVMAPKGRANARLALLVPTASYLAYANHQMCSSWDFDELSSAKFTLMSVADIYLEEVNGLGLSTYDFHGDGSGVCHSSWLRPILNMEPKGDLWQFTADTHITDWLEARGIEYDVITDDALEREGKALLARYGCVMTGTHPEYYSKAMLDGISQYLDQGGRLIYLGANGFYWRIAWHPTLPGTIEHRRSEDGMRAWFSEPGESYMAATGEYSGLWQRNGRSPNMLVGVAFTAQGFDLSAPYLRTEASHDPRASFIFEGIADGPIGDFGSIGGGAAGWEIDRVDARWGTPHHALVLATADDFPESYHWVKEEFNHSHSAINGDTCPLVRCDMVFFETPKGGAVFSTSSISWAGSLAHDNYRNNVSRITENVVRRFIDPTPIPAPEV